MLFTLQVMLESFSNVNEIHSYSLSWFFFLHSVSANAKLSPKLTNLKEGWALVPSRLGFPIPVNVAKLLANPQPLFDVNSDVKFDLYTLKNREEPQVLVLGDVESIKSSNFNKSLPTRIYVHGWQEHGSTMKNMFNDGEH